MASKHSWQRMQERRIAARGRDPWDSAPPAATCRRCQSANVTRSGHSIRCLACGYTPAYHDRLTTLRCACGRARAITLAQRDNMRRHNLLPWVCDSCTKEPFPHGKDYPTSATGSDT